MASYIGVCISGGGRFNLSIILIIGRLLMFYVAAWLAMDGA